MAVTEPADIHRAVADAFNAGDVDGLVQLYEPDARMVGPDGSVAVGHDAIREVWEGFVAMNGQISLTTRYAVEMGDVALLRNDWTFSADGADMASQTAEVVHRQPDGSWRYVIDHPFGSSADIP
jgi:uncharacterized protein (TIGR02246 family)